MTTLSPPQIEMAAPKEVSLRRATHSTDLVRDFTEMLSEEELFDVTLTCEEGSLNAHRIILAASSPYFRSIFSRLASSDNRNQYPIIFLKDIPFVDLKAIVEFIYRGEVILPYSQLQSLVRSAESLKVRGLNNDFEHLPANSHRRKKRRRRRRPSKGSAASEENGADETVSGTGTSEDEEEIRTQLTHVTDDRQSVSTVGDVEPSRLLEQSMTITGDVSSSY